jgi:hypothetical protein
MTGGSMKKFIVCLLTLTSSMSFAQSKISAACLEKTSNAIIDYLQMQEPKAELHLQKDDKGFVSGLTDANEIYADFDLQSVHSTGADTVVVVFNEGDSIVFAEVLVKQNGKVCQVLSVDSGQDDQD